MTSWGIAETTEIREPGSFRDPAGFIIREKDLYKRIVTIHGADDYEYLISSGLYLELTRRNLLIPHEEEPAHAAPQEGIYKVLRPWQVDFISYPYEWCFSQLKDAALATLQIQLSALKRGMTLKDATPYNIQFVEGRPMLIDTLSLQKDRCGPWMAYEQFCRLFLAPLLLAEKFPRALQLLRSNIEGFSLDGTSRALGWRSYFRPAVFIHIHLHARAIRWCRTSRKNTPNRKQGIKEKLALVESLSKAVEGCRKPGARAVARPASSVWEKEVAEPAEKFVLEVASRIKPHLTYDFSEGTGKLSKALAATGVRCVYFSRDPFIVEEVYCETRDPRGGPLMPLVMDLCDPSPPLGFGLEERKGLFQRPEAGLVVALGVTERLRLSCAIPFVQQARLLARLGRMVVVDFAEPQEVAVQAAMKRVGCAFPDYSRGAFIQAFHSAGCRLVEELLLPGTSRRLLAFERRK